MLHRRKQHIGYIKSPFGHCVFGAIDNQHQDQSMATLYLTCLLPYSHLGGYLCLFLVLTACRMYGLIVAALLTQPNAPNRNRGHAGLHPP